MNDVAWLEFDAGTVLQETSRKSGWVNVRVSRYAPRAEGSKPRWRNYWVAWSPGEQRLARNSSAGKLASDAGEAALEQVERALAARYPRPPEVEFLS